MRFLTMQTPQQKLYEQVAAEVQAKLDGGRPRGWGDVGRSINRGKAIGHSGRHAGVSRKPSRKAAKQAT